jgi:hypothetical protein
MGDCRTWQAEDYAAAREAAEHARRLSTGRRLRRPGGRPVEATASLTILPFQATRERAAQLYDDAHALARTDATISLEAARFLLQAGDAAGSRREAAQALDVEPRAATPRLALPRRSCDRTVPPGSRRRTLLDEALALRAARGRDPRVVLRRGAPAIDPKTVEALRRDLDRPASP